MCTQAWRRFMLRVRSSAAALLVCRFRRKKWQMLYLEGQSALSSRYLALFVQRLFGSSSTSFGSSSLCATGLQHARPTLCTSIQRSDVSIVRLVCATRVGCNVRVLGSIRASLHPQQRARFPDMRKVFCLKRMLVSPLGVTCLQGPRRGLRRVGYFSSYTLPHHNDLRVDADSNIGLGAYRPLGDCHSLTVPRVIVDTIALSVDGCQVIALACPQLKVLELSDGKTGRNASKEPRGKHMSIEASMQRLWTDSLSSYAEPRAR